MKMLRCFALVPALLLAVTACSDSSTQPVENDSRVGEVSFRYAGDRSGSFEARGELKLNASGTPLFGTYAAAGQQGTDFFIESFRARTRPKGDLFVLNLVDFNGPGTYTIDDDDCEAETCSLMLFALGFNVDNPQTPPDQVYFITTGSVVVTQVQDKRAHGTFSGSGFLIDLSTFEAGAEINITGGQFDAPILEGGIVFTLQPGGTDSFRSLLAAPRR